MKVLTIDQLEDEYKERYGEIIKEYNIKNLYYLESEIERNEVPGFEVEGYYVRNSPSLSYILPIKQYFTIIVESVSRSNINEPYQNYRFYNLEKLLEKKNKEKELEEP